MNLKVLIPLDDFCWTFVKCSMITVHSERVSSDDEQRSAIDSQYLYIEHVYSTSSCMWIYTLTVRSLFGAARAFKLSPVRVRAFATRWRSSGAESRRAAAATGRAPAAYKEESLHNPATKYSSSICCIEGRERRVYCVRRVYKYSTWAGVRSCACAMSHTVSFDSGCGSWFLQRTEQRTTNPKPCGVANNMQLSRLNRQIDHMAHWPRGCARNRL